MLLLLAKAAAFSAAPQLGRACHVQQSLEQSPVMISHNGVAVDVPMVEAMPELLLGGAREGRARRLVLCSQL